MRSFELKRHLPSTPILALTASTLEDDVREALEAGCDAHIAKPLRKEAVLAAIAAALESITIQPSESPPSSLTVKDSATTDRMRRMMRQEHSSSRGKQGERPALQLTCPSSKPIRTSFQ
jgi:DNA-binding response OmpR family regulator